MGHASHASHASLLEGARVTQLKGLAMLSLNTPWGQRKRLADLFVFETKSHRLGWPPLTMSLKMAELLIVLSLPPGCCDYSLVPPHPVLAALRMDESQGFQNARQALYRLSCIPALTKPFF